MTRSRDAAVIIVGGGPVGLVLATELGLRDVDTVVLDANVDIRDEPRAGTLHARTVQSLARRGYLGGGPQELSDGELRTPFHFGGMPALTITSPRAEGPPMLGMPQAELERNFQDLALRRGIDVRRGHRVVDVAQDEDHVELTVHSGHGEYRITAGHVVGCDGARSAVRQHAGFTSTSHPPNFAAIIGQVRLRDPASVRGGWTHSRHGWTLINPNPSGHSRVITHDFTRPLPDHRQPVELDEFRDTVSRILGQDTPMDDPIFLARFSDYCRLADSYRIGRIMLAGDAAHVHSPMGGQGLNLGIQDVFNLGWKLALVTSGAAPPSLLHTYHDERRPVAERVIANTRAQVALMHPGEEFDPLRNLMGELLGIETANNLVQGMISGQSVRYPAAGVDASELEGRFLTNAVVRTETGPTTVAELLTPGRGVLMLTDRAQPELADTARGWKDRIDVHEATTSKDLDWDAVLVRPDGYVAWCDPGGDTPAEQLAHRLTHWFGPGTGS